MNNSDRKRTRIGRPSADYVREALKALNKHKTIDDEDYFLKNLFPVYYAKVQEKAKEIDDYVAIQLKYGGDWIVKNFPSVKPGPIFGKIKKYWEQLFGDNLQNVDEKELLKATQEYLASLT